MFYTILIQYFEINLPTKCKEGLRENLNYNRIIKTAKEVPKCLNYKSNTG